MQEKKHPSFNSDEDPIHCILKYIVISKGEVYKEILDKFEQKNNKLIKYRNCLLNLSEVIVECANIITSKLNPQTTHEFIAKEVSDYNSFRLVNFHFFIGVFQKEIVKNEKFLKEDHECKRIDIFFHESAALELKILALFEGFLIRSNNNLLDPMYNHARELLKGIADDAELAKQKEKLRDFKQINTNYNRIFAEIIKQRKNRNQSNTKILNSIAKEYNLIGYIAILKTFQNKLPLIKKFPSLLIRYKSHYGNIEDDFSIKKIKPTKMLFEIATDEELTSIGTQLDTLIQ